VAVVPHATLVSALERRTKLVGTDRIRTDESFVRQPTGGKRYPFADPDGV
jgi:hypothetical protein